MRQSFPAVRRAAVVVIAVLSVVGALFLVWSLGTPERLGQLSNAQIAGIMALLVLPAATLVGWDLDRRACLRRGVDHERDVHLHDAAEAREPQAGHRHRVRSIAEERVAR